MPAQPTLRWSLGNRNVVPKVLGERSLGDSIRRPLTTGYTWVPFNIKLFLWVRSIICLDVRIVVRYTTDIRYIIFVSDIKIKYSYLYLILKKCLDIWKLCPNRWSPSLDFDSNRYFSNHFTSLQVAAEAGGVEGVDSYDQFDQSLLVRLALIYTDF